MLKVKSPAIKRPSGKIVTGRNHAAIGGEGSKGFLLSDNEFVGRAVAAKVAKKAGQTAPNVKLLHSHLLKK